MYRGGGEIISTDYKNYSDIQRVHSFKLPGLGKEVRFTIADGEYIRRVESAVRNKENLNLYSAAQSRRLQVRSDIVDSLSAAKGKADKGKSSAVAEELWVELDVLTLKVRDAEFLQETIRKVEGLFDTFVDFDNPGANQLSGGQQRVNLIGTEGFFFRS